MRETLAFYRTLNAASRYGKLAFKPFQRGLPGLFQKLFQALYNISGDIIRCSEKKEVPIVWFQGMIPVELGWALGIYPLVSELTPYIIAAFAEPLAHDYLDLVEAAGYPSDTCTAARVPCGFLLAGELPRPDLIVTTAMPCDNYPTYYVEMERRHPDTPIYRADAPFLGDEEGLDYHVEEILRMIAWIEDVADVKLTEARLREVVEESNRTLEYMLAIQDLMKQAPAAIPCWWLWFLIPILVESGKPRATELVKSFYEDARRMADEGAHAVREERFRYVQWGIPSVFGLPVYIWLEKVYGAVMVSSMLAMTGMTPVDVSSMESMLRGIVRNSRNTIMSSQSFGPSERFTDDLARQIKEYDANLVLHFDHQGCKNTLGITSLFRGVAKDLGVPMGVINLDALDSRIVSIEGIKSQLERFMETLAC